MLIRIRADQDKIDDYRIRTLEVEKARGQAIERGQHHMLIRTGRGSTTGGGEYPKENPDDPRTANAYVMVVPSVHALNRRVMSQTPALDDPSPGGNDPGGKLRNPPLATQPPEAPGRHLVQKASLPRAIRSPTSTQCLSPCPRTLLRKRISRNRCRPTQAQ